MAEKANIETITNLSRRAFLATAAAVGLGRLVIAQSTPAGHAIVQPEEPPKMIARFWWPSPEKRDYRIVRIRLMNLGPTFRQLDLAELGKTIGQEPLGDG